MSRTTEKAVEATAAAPVASSAPAFTLDRLRKECLPLFGVTSSTFDGATMDMDASGKYTVDAVKEHIAQWRDTKFRKGGK